MSEPFLAEVKIFGFNFAPRGFAFCDGQILPIDQNQSLYSLLGTSFGGDGRTSFALPDLRGRVPVHTGGGPGLRGGAENSPVTAGNMPGHTHAMQATSEAAESAFPAGRLLAKPGGRRTAVPYGNGAGRTQMRPTGAAGSSHGPDNMQPSLVVNFCIALTGLFPPRN
jgi:microcystin-dependent protein